MSGAGAFLAPEITLPASAEALARSSATRKLTLGPLLLLLVAAVVVVMGKEAVVPMVVSGVRRGRVVARVDGTGNLPPPPTIADAAAVGAVVAVGAAFSSLLFFSALPPW